MQDAGNGLRVGEHAGDLAHGAIVVHGVKFARIHERIPVRHVNDVVIILHAGVIEFREEAAGLEIVVIFIDLAERVADFEVRFEIVHPVALGAVDRHAAVGTLEVRVCWGQTGGFSGRLGLSRFGIVRRDGGSGLCVIWVWAEGVLFDEGCSLADCWRGRVREGVE